MARDPLVTCEGSCASAEDLWEALYTSVLYASVLSHTTLDRTCKTLSAEAERDAPILALIIQLKFNLMLLVRVRCSCTVLAP